MSEKACEGLGSCPRQKEEQARKRDCAGLSRGQEARHASRMSEKLLPPLTAFTTQRKNNTVLKSVKSRQAARVMVLFIEMANGTSLTHEN